MKNIVLFASGSGSNAEQIMKFFNEQKDFKVAAVFTNNPNAGVIQRAEKYAIPVFCFNREDFNTSVILNKLAQYTPDLIVLAGFLWKFPEHIVKQYQDKIINIHPALLPKYGGKGMYGINVHKAVLENKDAVSGISIHYVNENYDEGNIIFQQEVSVADCATPEEVALKVLSLEHEHFPKIIAELLKK